MAARIWLVRHAHTSVAGRVLTGRAGGVALSAEGRRQAAALGEAFAGLALARVVSSPLERTRETAAAIAAPHGLPVEVREPWTEVDFGHWTGRSIESLLDDDHWRRYNARRAVTRIPGGELLLEVQARAVADLLALADEEPEGELVIVSHAEVLRATLLHLLGSSLDAWERVAVEPASASLVTVAPWEARVERLGVLLEAGASVAVP